jgi:hypothetical protein
MGIAERINIALQLAGWAFSKEGGEGAMFGGVVGIFVSIHPDADESTKRAEASLISALNACGIKAASKPQNPTNNPKHNNLSLQIGAKR